MTHHTYGNLIAIDDLGGLLEVDGCVLISSYILIHAETTAGTPVMGVQLAGHIQGSEDTINTVYLLNPKEAGALVYGFLKSAEQLDPDEQLEFQFASQGLIEGAPWNEDEDGE